MSLRRPTPRQIQGRRGTVFKRKQAGKPRFKRAGISKVRPKPVIRKTGQRFSPQVKKQRTKTRLAKSRIRRVSQLSRTRSVDIRKVDRGGFKIFAPRNTPPAITVEGRKFTENPDTRPSNLGQLQIRSKQVRAFKAGQLPRQKIDRAVSKVGNLAFDIGTELFKTGSGVKDTIFQAGVSTREAVEKQRAKNIAEKRAGVPALESAERKRQFDLFKQQAGDAIVDTGKGVARFIGGGLAGTGLIITTGVTGLGAVDRVLKIGGGIEKQRKKDEQTKLGKVQTTSQAVSSFDRGGLFGIQDLTPIQQRAIAGDPFAFFGTGQALLSFDRIEPTPLQTPSPEDTKPKKIPSDKGVAAGAEGSFTRRAGLKV